MTYHLIPTTVFTPDEYAFTGLTQEEAERDEKGNMTNNIILQRHTTICAK